MRSSNDEDGCEPALGGGSYEFTPKVEVTMATMIRKTAYFSMQTVNRVGQAAKILNGLRDAGINLLGFTGFPNSGRAQVDFVPDDVGKFLRAAKRLALKVSKRKTAFIATGDDRPGAIAAICDKLAKARVNLVAIDGVTAGKGRFGAIFWVKPKDVTKAARVLRAK